MLRDFRFQHGTVGNVGRIGHYEIHCAHEFRQQAGIRHVTGDQVNRSVGGIAPGVAEGGGVVVHRDHPGAGH